MLAADLIGTIVVDKHNPISETISALALGKYAWIQDVGLDLFAAALLACAIGLYSLKLGGFRWKLGTALLGLLCVNVLLIAEYNQYANRDSIGSTIHLYLVCILGIAFALLTFLLAPGLRKVGLKWHRFTLWIAILWTVLAPFFFLIPTGWDGAYERFVALIMVTWVTGMSWLLISQRRRHTFAHHN